MTMELTVQLPVITWTPKPALKKEPLKKMRMEETL